MQYLPSPSIHPIESPCIKFSSTNPPCAVPRAPPRASPLASLPSPPFPSPLPAPSTHLSSIAQQQARAAGSPRHARARVKLATWAGSVFSRDAERRALPLPSSTSDWLLPRLGNPADDKDTLEDIDKLKRKMSSAERQLEDAQSALRHAESDVTRYTAPPPPPPPSGPSVTVTPLSIRSGEEVVVSWTGIINPTDDDFVAVVTPPGGPNSEILERVLVTASEGWHTGSGLIKVSRVVRASSCIATLAESVR